MTAVRKNRPTAGYAGSQEYSVGNACDRFFDVQGYGTGELGRKVASVFPAKGIQDISQANWGSTS